MNEKSLNILIVEDELHLGDTLVDYLDAKGHKCLHKSNATEAKIAFQSNQNFDVVLMDIGLPDGNGLELAKAFRENRKNFVLLFLSALNDPETKFKGLDLGAEDYITKPFDIRELELRLNRILKNKNITQTLPDEVEIGPLKIWFKRYEVQDSSGNILNLSTKECKILELLYLGKNNVISRDEIIEKVWGEDSFPSNRTVDNYIVKLRKWIDTVNSDHFKISSIRGVGYRLEIKGE